MESFAGFRTALCIELNALADEVGCSKGTRFMVCRQLAYILMVRIRVVDTPSDKQGYQGNGLFHRTKLAIRVYQLHRKKLSTLYPNINPLPESSL